MDKRRLSTWKEISAYLNRDERTVARWAKSSGLPVHRIPGLRSVFAYSDEIDAWLAGSGRDEVLDLAPEPAPRLRVSRRWLLTAAAVLLMLGTLAAPRLFTRPVPLVTVEAHGRDLVAMSPASRVAWVHHFDESIRIAEPRADRVVLTDLDGDGAADLVASILGGLPVPMSGAPQDSEALFGFSSAGRLSWKLELDDVLRFGGREFERPWYTNVVRLTRASDPRFIWLAHHHTWWPSLATLVDARGTRLGTFTHPGWLTNAAPVESGEIVVAGVNNALDADVVAILDPQSFPGAAPDPPSGGYACDGCAGGRPYRYFVLPRSELSHGAERALNPAYIHVFPTLIEVRIHQAMDAPTAELIYEFSRDFRLLRVRPSDAYWTWHRRLEAAGVVTHSAEQCPERGGVSVRSWDRTHGWTVQRVGPD